MGLTTHVTKRASRRYILAFIGLFLFSSLTYAFVPAQAALAVAPLAVSNLRTEFLEDIGEIEVLWGINPDDLNEATDVTYTITVTYGEEDTVLGTITDYEFTNVYFKLNEMQPGVKYTTTISAVNALGETGPASSVSFTTPGEAIRRAISNVLFTTVGDDKFLVVEGSNMVDDGQQALFKSLVTLRGVALPFCSEGTGMNKQQYIESFSEVSPSVATLVSDEPSCYFIMDTQGQMLGPQSTQIRIWLPSNYDVTSPGSVTLDSGLSYAFNQTDGSGPSTPSAPSAPVVINAKKITEIATRPTFSGKTTPGATVTVTVHSDPVTCTTTADQNGNWSCTLPSDLPLGSHSVYMRVVANDGSVQEFGPYPVVVTAEGTSLAVITSDTPLVPNTGRFRDAEAGVSWLNSLVSTLFFAAVGAVGGLLVARYTVARAPRG